ncbi:MAG: CBS domain-containing protein [Saprospiraceae bacterium]|nr:CBS domain-containing protein [Saprospiraceae bacterium]
MGDFNVKRITTDSDRVAFYQDVFRDLKAFESMLEQGIIEDRSDTIGAEQEMCIVERSGLPSPTALDILSRINDERYTNELALYNLEINLSPQPLKDTCFSDTEAELMTCLSKGRQLAAENDDELFLSGMLPTLGFRHLMFEYMTPEERYRMLSEELLKLRGKHFEIMLEGIDDFQATLDSVLFEACNTSFQTHLQISPKEFVNKHNWAQMISGPVLGIAVNSPLLFGKELWAENRIALFKQSVDTRGEKNHSLETLPRVYFGKQWIQDSAAELWRENVVRFPVLLRGYGGDDPLESLNQGKVPKLKSLGLHNGTTYTWNRLCYGVANNSPHIRIECRYLPSGPSVIDEIANFAFWVGLMKGQPEELETFWKNTDFRVAKSNFLHSAKMGLQSVMHWFGKNYPTRKLILEELLPMSKTGLEMVGVGDEEINKYLSIIEQRALSEKTGAQWQKNNYRKLKDKYKPGVATRLLVQFSVDQQKENRPVHEWEDMLVEAPHTLPEGLDPDIKFVEDIMNRDVISVRQNVGALVASRMMEWKQFNHIPVEDANGRLVGILTKRKADEYQEKPVLVKDIMTFNVIAIKPQTALQEAKELMIRNTIGSLPVVENGILVGIVTAKDFPDYRPA